MAKPRKPSTARKPRVISTVLPLCTSTTTNSAFAIRP
jgi:hypothetical protein